jgi:hypothetical protein
MILTTTESRIVQRLRQQLVAAYAELVKQLDVSAKTVQRAVSKVGYYNSLNFNSVYVTLQNTPRFDPRGLWVHRQICFSRHGGLRSTIRVLVQQAREGWTVDELQRMLGTRVHNQLAGLLREGEIQHFYLGGHAIYTSADPTQAQQQQAQRQRQTTPASATVRPAYPAPELPPGIDAATVIRLLVQMLQKPDASPASLSKSLQAHGVAVHAEQVRQVLAFYGLKKTTR